MGYEAVSTTIAYCRTAVGRSSENNLMNDSQVFSHIEDLVAEEERLYAHEKITPEDRERLHAIKIELDQYWDLLRQRRALNESGENPDQATLRDANIVEHYEQ
jgi:hypothetical protein